MTILRTLGKSGIQVSALGLGTARIGGLDWQRDDLAVHYRQDQVDAAIYVCQLKSDPLDH